MEQQFLAKWYSNILKLKMAGSSVDRIGMTLFNSKIKLTPHQIDAALFAFKSPINKGVILADEVGLGKTIEAGIVIAQLWYEKKARVLIIAPASLMRQWSNELYDKFMLTSEVIDRKQYNNNIKKGIVNPFNSDSNIVICSYQFASIMCDEISNSKFDTVIIDEAHKLRNVYNEKAITSNNIKKATSNFKKILLTATPIQNNLMDLYGLSSFIDDNIFGDKNVFRYNYIKNYNDNCEELSYRIKQYMHRTLRKQVVQYIKFTNRIAKTFSFMQTEEEKKIYDELRNILLNSDENPYIIPSKQKHLLLLILSKLMGSSVYALKGTLETILDRLNNLKNGSTVDLIESIIDDDMLSDYEEIDYEEINNNSSEMLKTEEIDKIELEREILIISNLIKEIDGIKKESKFYSLLDSLNFSFQYLKELGANEKVIIFTESRRTQDFLYDSLIEAGYNDILTYNGSNSDENSNKIYQEWINRPENIDKIKNSKNLNMRTAIIEEFKDNGKILIATEAGAEGLNLQFCSLLINYDLPWNPQKVEQRIGRCHRFGQKYDVAVINFINVGNKVEERIYELLSSKFNLFNEVFGASDEILGSLDDGKDIEKAISEIYSSCRNEDEINLAFDQLQEKYNDDINKVIDKAKKELIDNFEEDVQNYFENTMRSTEKSINNIEETFWKLAKLVLKNTAEFDDDNYIIKVYNVEGFNGIYKLSSRNDDNDYIDLNINTELGKYIINKANNDSLVSGKIVFDVTNYQYNIAQIQKLKNKGGYISLSKFIISSFDNEEYLFFNGITDDGEYLDDELCQKFFRLKSNENIKQLEINNIIERLNADSLVFSDKLKNESFDRNNLYLKDEIVKINKWAEDKIQATELSVELMREQRKELQKQSDLSTNLNDKERLEKDIILLTDKIKKSWIELGNAEEEIEMKRKKMVDSIKRENMKSVSLENVFTIRFEVV